MEGGVVVCGLRDGGAGVCLCLFLEKKCYAMGTLFILPLLLPGTTDFFVNANAETYDPPTRAHPGQAAESPGREEGVSAGGCGCVSGGKYEC